MQRQLAVLASIDVKLDRQPILPAPVQVVPPVTEAKELPDKGPAPAVLKAVEWLKAHPEHGDKSARTIAEMMGVSHTVVVKAKKLL